MSKTTNKYSPEVRERAVRTLLSPDGTLMMEIATPAYGYKTHIGADRRYRFIRTWAVTDAATHDGRELGGLLDRSNTASAVWADTAYRSQKNEGKIAKAGLVSKVHFRKPPGKPMPDARRRANSARSRPRSGVEHVFADQKHRMGLFIRQSASHGPERRSAWPTSPIACAATCSGRRERPPRSQKQGKGTRVRRQPGLRNSNLRCAQRLGRPQCR